MRLRIWVVLLFLPLSALAQTFNGGAVIPVDASRNLREAVEAAGTRWVAWTIPTSGITICSSWKDCKSGRCGNATLNGSGFSMSDDQPHRTSEVLLVARMSGTVIEKIRIFDASCPIEASKETITLLEGVSAAESVKYLSSAKHADADWLAALSLHDDPSVVPALIQLARSNASSKVRRQAIFWLGQKAGVEAAGELRHAVDHDPQDEVREHAVFAISQLPRERSVPMLIDLVKKHKSRRVRERAMFWLAESGDPRALELMEEILLK
jgi:hypothetical protein